MLNIARALFYVLVAAFIVGTTAFITHSCKSSTAKPAESAAPAVERMYKVSEGPDFQVYAGCVINGHEVFVVTRTSGGVGITAH
jgi:hypothetical protein